MRFSPEQLAGLAEPSDRRARVRRNPSEVTCLELGEGNGGIVLNVSETGIAIAVAQTILEDHIPRLSFRLPQLDRTFLAEGEIVWRSESQKSAGLRFVNLEERDRVQIRNWIRAEIVSTELQTPLEASPAAAKPVLMMPSPRQVASTRAQSEAERDESRAAEFDRMFPSEATLTLHDLGPVETAEPEFNFLAETTEAEDVEIAAEAFYAAQEAHQATDELDVSAAETGDDLVAEHSLSPELSDERTTREIDWREKWEVFHRERENLERSRSQETMLELPAPFSAPLPESTAEGREELPHAASSNEQIVPSPIAETLIGPSSASRVTMPPKRDAVAGSIFGSSLIGTYQKPARVEPSFSPNSATPVVKVAAAPPNEKNPLSIAALCIVLVAMCFILGYAIQPGAFRFARPISADTAGETAASNTPASSAQEPIATTSAPPADAMSTTRDTTSSAAYTTPKPDDTPAATEKEDPVNAEPKSPAPKDTGSMMRSAQPTKSDAATEKSLVASAAAARAKELEGNSANAAAATVSTPAPTPSISASSPAPSAPAAAPAVSTSPASSHEAVIPVSFFPVTAPSEGAPAKLMQLPEETISETSLIVVRSHQFLFVPAQPGPESEHPLERVHLGDRMVKIDPSYPAQALEKSQGGSVHLRTTIGTNGSVVDVQPISGPTNLIPAAVSAVRQWRYKPTDIDGTPIAIEEDIVIEFRPRREVVAAR